MTINIGMQIRQGALPERDSKKIQRRNEQNLANENKKCIKSIFGKKQGQ